MCRDYRNRHDCCLEKRIYKGELTKDFTISKKPIKKLKIVAGSLAGTITGSDLSTIYDTPNKNKVSVTIKGKDDFTREVKKNVTVN